MERTRKEIHQLNTLFEVVCQLLGETGRVTHSKAISDFQLLIDQIEEIAPPNPHIIKDAKKMTVTVFPQGKEKEFIESTKVAQPHQRRQFILILFWGLLTINF